MQLKLDMSCHLLNVYTKFQIDISKHVEEKSGKRGRTDGRTDVRSHETPLLWLVFGTVGNYVAISDHVADHTKRFQTIS